MLVAVDPFAVVGLLVIAWLVSIVVYRAACSGEGRSRSLDAPNLVCAAEPGARLELRPAKFATRIHEASERPVIIMPTAAIQPPRARIAMPCHAIEEPVSLNVTVNAMTSVITA